MFRESFSRSDAKVPRQNPMSETSFEIRCSIISINFSWALSIFQLDDATLESRAFQLVVNTILGGHARANLRSTKSGSLTNRADVAATVWVNRFG